MVATRAIIGYGTTVFLSDSSSPGVFTQIQEVIEVTPPNAQVDDVEATHFTSDNRTREYIAGLIEGGEASIAMNRIPGSATEILLMGLQTTATKVVCRIIWPNGTMWEFLCHVKGYETSAPIDDRMTATATVKVDGASTITIGSPAPG